MAKKPPPPPNMWAGWRIVVTADKPNRQLALDVPVSQDMRDKVNAWMVEFFGTQNLLTDTSVVVLGEAQTLWMNPRVFARLPPATECQKFFEEFKV